MSTVDPDEADQTRRLKRLDYQREYRAKHRDKIRVQNLARQLRWRAANLEKVQARDRERAREWRAANPEKVRAIDHARRGHWAAANPEKARAGYRRRRQRWVAANPEKVRDNNRQWREANPEKAQANLRRWKERNPERVDWHRNQRRAAKLAAPSEPWTKREIFERDGWTCMIPDCRCPTGRAIDPALRSPDRWSGTIDHVMPIVRGGTDLKRNLQAAHYACNSAKGDTWDEGLSHAPDPPD